LIDILNNAPDDENNFIKVSLIKNLVFNKKMALKENLGHYII